MLFETSQASSLRAACSQDLLVCSVLLLFSTEAAVGCADGFGCAVVKKTADNFVALRASKSANATLVTKLQPYEILVVTVSDCESPNWQAVDCVPRLDGDCYQPSKRYTSGWVNKSLIKLTACPKDVN
jgi:hypothetical protein